MNLLDENFPKDQIPLLRATGLLVRQLGKDIAALGIQDDNILPVLHRYRNITFLTQDQDFFRRRLCHPSYCLVWLDVRPRDTADFVLRFMAHPEFRTHAQRMAKVIRVHYDCITCWDQNRLGLLRVNWEDC